MVWCGERKGRRSAWAAVGGYDHIQFGWEDYDFWCKLAERAEEIRNALYHHLDFMKALVVTAGDSGKRR